MSQPPEGASVLLEKARGDAYVVSKSVNDMGIADWIAGFHAQQAAEKALKAILVYRGIDYPRTHNLRVLSRLLQGGGFEVPPGVDDLNALSPYGTAARYGDFPAFGPDTSLDRRWALACVERTLEWAARLLESKP